MTGESNSTQPNGDGPLRVAVTGTPGTGKTTATDRLRARPDAACEVVHLNDVVRDEGLYEDEDPDRGSLIADLDALADWLDDRVAACGPGVDAVVFESHLAHHIAADRVAVLRCAPDALEARLEARGENAEMAREKSAENAESEALDLLLSEAVAAHGEANVYEIDTTDATVDEVAGALGAVVEGTREPSAGEVDFTEYL